MEGYPAPWCTSPYTADDCPECEGAWDCEYVYAEANAVFTEYNTNGDGYINLGDDIDQSHLAIMTEYCDMNGDGQICEMELAECFVMCENSWRDEFCPNFGYLYCTIEPC
jgi:hypothetical protein